MYDVAEDVGEAEVAAVVEVSEAFVIEAEEVQDGGVEIVGVHGVDNGFETDLIGGAVGDAAFHAATGEEGGEGPVVMFAPGGVGLVVEGSAAELGGPHHKRVIQHAPTLEVGEQPVNGSVDLLGEALVVHHVAVAVPVAGGAGVNELDEPHAALGQPPGGEALPAEAIGLAAFHSVQRMCSVGFLLEIKYFGHSHLHAERSFKRAHAGGQLGIGRAGLKVALVALAQGGQLEFLQVARHARGDVRHGAGAGLHAGALMRAGQEIRAPHLTARVGRLRRQHHERRQVPVLRAQSVTYPCADARPADCERAGVHAERGIVMVRVAGVHAIDKRDVIHALGHLGKQRADLLAALAVLFEIPLRTLQENALVAWPVLNLRMVALRNLLAVALDQLGLGVKRVDVRHTAAEVHENDALGPR